MYPRYQVLPFSEASLIAFIEHFTETPYSIVQSKRQIKYLNGYLKRWSIVSMLIETTYIDSSFVEDFSQYYVKCFQHHKRNCSRIHFFNETAEEVVELISESEQLSEDKEAGLKQKYLGYVVVRPIFETILSKACLRKWDSKEFLISEPHIANFLGLNFSVDTIPFQEQDHVLAVCATSALWTYQFGRQKSCHCKILSPYEITQIATKGQFDESTLTHQLKGLSLSMMSKVISNMGLKPVLYKFSDKKSHKILSTFLESKIPVILGLDIFDLDNNKQGSHAVVALGCNTFDGIINELYIHDDRIGPYARLMKDESGKEWIMSLDLDNGSYNNEKYIITDLLIGLYPKVRLPFDSADAFASSFINELSFIDEEAKSMFFYRLKLIDGSEYKSLIRNNEKVIDKQVHLEKALPKFCWIVQIYASLEGEEVFLLDFIIDSTATIQENYILDLIYYSEEFKTQVVDVLIDKIYSDIEKYGGDVVNDYFSEDFLPFYLYTEKLKDNSYETFLDQRYGCCHTPKNFHPFELNNGMVKDQHAIILRTLSDVGSFMLDKNKVYIWAIDSSGYLRIGFDININGNKMGHPTLLRGLPGRIAGELKYEEGEWRLNYFSGRFSSDLYYSTENKQKYINNVLNDKINVFFPNEHIKIYIPSK